MTLDERDKDAEESRGEPLPFPASSPNLPSLEVLSFLPEEEIWLANQRSPHTRRAYKLDLRHFLTTLGIRDRDALRSVTRPAVLAWIRLMENEQARPRTIGRRIAALSSLYIHLVERGVVTENPFKMVKRPKVNNRRGTTAAFSEIEARKLLDSPPPDTLEGIRDRAILSVLLQAGPRRAEVASMTVKDFHTHLGYPSLHFVRKGGEDHTLALNPQTAQRIQVYLMTAGHGEDYDGPLFRPVTGLSRKEPGAGLRRHLDPDLIDKLVRKYAKRALGVERGYSAHSCRATFGTTALLKGAGLEDVQEAMGHADISTTRLYDRRSSNPERSAAFKVNY